MERKGSKLHQIFVVQRGRKKEKEKMHFIASTEAEVRRAGL